jgi:hypothetical protein
VLQIVGSSCWHPVLEANTVAGEVDPVTTPEMAATLEMVTGGFGGLMNTGDA